MSRTNRFLGTITCTTFSKWPCRFYAIQLRLFISLLFFFVIFFLHIKRNWTATKANSKQMKARIDCNCIRLCWQILWLRRRLWAAHTFYTRNNKMCCSDCVFFIIICVRITIQDIVFMGWRFVRTFGSPIEFRIRCNEIRFIEWRLGDGDKWSTFSLCVHLAEINGLWLAIIC